MLPGWDVISGVGGISHAACSIGTKTHNKPIPTTDLKGIRMLMILLEVRNLQ